MPRRLPPLFAVCLLGAIGATEPDAATRRWWSHIRVLAADEMEGRDTGSDGYRKAAAYVAARFEAAGLAPAGERGYYQTVPMHAVRLVPEQSTVELVGRSGQVLRLYRRGTRPAGIAVLRRTHHRAQGTDRRRYQSRHTAPHLSAAIIDDARARPIDAGPPRARSGRRWASRSRRTSSRCGSSCVDRISGTPPGRHPSGAARFNAFFARLLETVADAPVRPSMTQESAATAR